MQELETGPLHRFQDWPNEQVLKRAVGVYTVWEGDRLLYVGMSGPAMTAEDLEVSEGGRVVAPMWPSLSSEVTCLLRRVAAGPLFTRTCLRGPSPLDPVRP